MVVAPMLSNDIIKFLFLGKRVLIKTDEYTFSWSGSTQDCYAGDTGVIEYIDFDYYSQENFDSLCFVVKLDEELFEDGRTRVSSSATCDFNSIKFIY